MKILTSVIILLLFVANITFSQWVQISTIGNNDLRGVKFFNEFTGIIVGQGGIWRSTNSGVNWIQVLNGQNINSLSFPDNNIGYAVGDSGKIYKTLDGGSNWSQIGVGVTFKNLNTVSFPSLNIGWIMGQTGKILYTYNGGSSFINQTNGDTTRDINYLQMINNTTGYFCGSSNVNAETFGYSPNGGINWLNTLFTGGNTLNAVSYIPTSGSNAVAVGTNGRIRKTTSNGTTWIIITSPSAVKLNHIVFLDVNTGYIIGNSGIILKTTNSSFNWSIDAVVTSNNLKSTSFINPNTAWIVGSNGVVIRTGIPVGLQGQIGSVKNFMLEQNYPNPFNTTTLIYFEIPKNSFVKLIIFDLIGNEVTMLVNKEMTLGKYEISFNAENLPSGVYIFKLEINREYTEYKKMVLIK